MIPRVVEGWYGVYDRKGELLYARPGEAAAWECSTRVEDSTIASISIVRGLEDYVVECVDAAKALARERAA